MKSTVVALLCLSSVALSEDSPAAAEPEHHHVKTLQELVMDEDRQTDAIQRQIVALTRKSNERIAIFISNWLRHVNLGLATVDPNSQGTSLGVRISQLNDDIIRLRDTRDSVFFPPPRPKDPHEKPRYVNPRIGFRAWTGDEVWQWLHGPSVELFLETRNQQPDTGPQAVEIPPPPVAHEGVPSTDPRLPPIQLGLPGTPVGSPARGPYNNEQP